MTPSVNLSGDLSTGTPTLSATLTVINPPVERQRQINGQLLAQIGLELLKWVRLLVENLYIRLTPRKA